MVPQNREVQVILVIDDDPDDYELVEEAFREINPNISVYYINKCEQIIKYRRKRIDLVLLDINMPLHDGFDWLQSIRKHASVDLPVIMYSNSLFPVHIEKAYKEGANLYFIKPETYPHLKQGLAKLIKLDWSDPGSITRQYQQPGYTGVFSI